MNVLFLYYGLNECTCKILKKYNYIDKVCTIFFFIIWRYQRLSLETTELKMFSPTRCQESEYTLSGTSSFPLHDSHSSSSLVLYMNLFSNFFVLSYEEILTKR